MPSDVCLSSHPNCRFIPLPPTTGLLTPNGSERGIHDAMLFVLNQMHMVTESPPGTSLVWRSGEIMHLLRPIEEAGKLPLGGTGAGIGSGSSGRLFSDVELLVIADGGGEEAGPRGGKDEEGTDAAAGCGCGKEACLIIAEMKGKSEMFPRNKLLDPVEDSVRGAKHMVNQIFT